MNFQVQWHASLFQWPKEQGMFTTTLSANICIIARLWPVQQTVSNQVARKPHFCIMAALPWVQELQALVTDHAMPINQRASKAMSVLRDAGLAYSVKLLPKDVLIHTCNRGGQMVNAFDVVTKGKAICEVGWDKNKIREPVAFELPHDLGKRQSMIDANMKLALQSNGMLAKPFGKERCCSISASHTTCFLRCLEAGCKLGSDHLSVEELVAKGDNLGELLHQGWDWTVIAAKAEEEVPTLPNLLQQAYNSHLFGKKQCCSARLMLLVFFLLWSACCSMKPNQVTLALQSLQQSWR